MLDLLQNPPEGLMLGDVWFNGWKHLPQETEHLGVNQAETLTEQLEKRRLPWNQTFGGRAVVVHKDDRLPEKTLPGGMTLTLLSPTPERLKQSRVVWGKEVQTNKHWPTMGTSDQVSGGLEVLGTARPDLDKLAKSPFKPDDSAANGSSIAFVASLEGKRCLFTGDAFAADIKAPVERLAREEREVCLPLDAFKLAHNGGQKNTSLELLSPVACKRYLFSTDGSVYRHPDQESVARVVANGRKRGAPQLFFNYRSGQSLVWNNRTLFRDRFEPIYPDKGQEGIVIDL